MIVISKNLQHGGPDRTLGAASKQLLGRRAKAKMELGYERISLRESNMPMGNPPANGHSKGMGNSEIRKFIEESEIFQQCLIPCQTFKGWTVQRHKRQRHINQTSSINFVCI